MIATAPSPVSRSTVHADSALTRGAVLAGAFLVAVFLVLAWGALRDTAFGENAPTVAVAAAKSPPAAPSLSSAFAKRLVAEAAPIPAKASPAPAPSPAPAASPVLAASPVSPWHGSATSIGRPAQRWGTTPSTLAPTSSLALGAGPVPAPLVAERSTLVASSTRTFTSAAVQAINLCNGTDNVGGQAVNCTVTITNNLNLTTGATSSVVTVKECHGAAGAALPCTTTTTPSAQLATSVVQCDGSGSGGGGTVTCAVNIINNITGAATATGATVNQCNGSGAGGGTQPTLLCNPTANTTGATITQCNGSGNGGGGSIRVQCSVSPSTAASALPVSIDQCNGSGNGGGALVICTASITNNITTPGGTTGGTTGGGGGGGTTGTGGGGTTGGDTTGGGTIRLDTARVPSGLTTIVTGRLPSTPLAFTGAHTTAMALLALLAIALGGLLILLSGQAITRPRREVA